MFGIPNSPHYSDDLEGEEKPSQTMRLNKLKRRKRWVSKKSASIVQGNMKPKIFALSLLFIGGFFLSRLKLTGLNPESVFRISLNPSTTKDNAKLIAVLVVANYTKIET